VSIEWSFLARAEHGAKPQSSYAAEIGAFHLKAAQGLVNLSSCTATRKKGTTKKLIWAEESGFHGFGLGK
jgi:hypothetical protein